MSFRKIRGRQAVIFQNNAVNMRQYFWNNAIFMRQILLMCNGLSIFENTITSLLNGTNKMIAWRSDLWGETNVCVTTNTCSRWRPMSASLQTLTRSWKPPFVVPRTPRNVASSLLTLTKLWLQVPWVPHWNRSTREFCQTFYWDI